MSTASNARVDESTNTLTMQTTCSGCGGAGFDIGHGDCAFCNGTGLVDAMLRPRQQYVNKIQWIKDYRDVAKGATLVESKQAFDYSERMYQSGALKDFPTPDEAWAAWRGGMSGGSSTGKGSSVNWQAVAKVTSPPFGTKEVVYRDWGIRTETAPPGGVPQFQVVQWERFNDDSVVVETRGAFRNHVDAEQFLDLLRVNEDLAILADQPQEPKGKGKK